MESHTKWLILEEIFMIGSIPLVWLLPKPINYVAYTFSLGLGILFFLYHKTKDKEA